MVCVPGSQQKRTHTRTARTLTNPSLRDRSQGGCFPLLDDGCSWASYHNLARPFETL